MSGKSGSPKETTMDLIREMLSNLGADLYSQGRSLEKYEARFRGAVPLRPTAEAALRRAKRELACLKGQVAEVQSVVDKAIERVSEATE